MTKIENEPDLRALFAHLKEEQRARTPSFHATVAAARRRRPRPRRALRVAAAAAAIVVISLAYQQREAAVRRERARAEVRHGLLAGSRWATPTDFLLNTPGSRLLRTVPTFGSDTWIGTSKTLRTRNQS
jgi:hypothetical protein